MKISALHPIRSKFNLSHEWKLTTDMGQIRPFLVLDCIPSDLISVKNEIVVRTQPLVAPIMHEVNIYTHYFFVPYRILFGEMVYTGDITEDPDWDHSTDKVWEIHNQDFETFLTGGVTGKNKSVTLPYWVPTGNNVTNADGRTVADNGVGSLWDSFGLPVGKIPLKHNADGVTTHGAVNSFLKRAYNMIWNEYWRNENLQPMVDLDSDIILNCNWGKDYFTSALPYQQRGIAPAINIDGTIPVTISGQGFAPLVYSSVDSEFPMVSGQFGKLLGSDSTNPYAFGYDTNGDNLLLSDGTSIPYKPGGTKYNKIGVTLNDLSGSATATGHLTSVDTKDLRLMFQIQKILERNMRSGYRLSEFLLSTFGTTIPDATLQRPLYLGGSKQPLIVSEVLQTSASADGTTKQGNMAGHGISVAFNKACKFYCHEYGLLLGLMVIKPKANYSQGINKCFMKRDSYDFFRPQFCNLSENAVEQIEIYADNGASDNEKIFGYQEMYNEYKHIPNKSVGLFNTIYDYWHLGRQFANAPKLNSSFITCIPRKDCFTSQNEDAFFVNVGNVIKAYRPIPKYSTPGLIDHS